MLPIQEVKQLEVLFKGKTLQGLFEGLVEALQTHRAMDASQPLGELTLKSGEIVTLLISAYREE